MEMFRLGGCAYIKKKQKLFTVRLGELGESEDRKQLQLSPVFIITVTV